MPSSKLFSGFPDPVYVLGAWHERALPTSARPLHAPCPLPAWAHRASSVLSAGTVLPTPSPLPSLLVRPHVSFESPLGSIPDWSLSQQSSRGALLCPHMDSAWLSFGAGTECPGDKGRCLGRFVERLSDGPWAERLPAYCDIPYTSRSRGRSEPDGRPPLSCPSGCWRPRCAKPTQRAPLPVYLRRGRQHSCL